MSPIFAKQKLDTESRFIGMKDLANAKLKQKAPNHHQKHFGLLPWTGVMVLF